MLIVSPVAPRCAPFGTEIDSVRFIRNIGDIILNSAGLFIARITVNCHTIKQTIIGSRCIGKVISVAIGEQNHTIARDRIQVTVISGCADIINIDRANQCFAGLFSIGCCSFNTETLINYNCTASWSNISYQPSGHCISGLLVNLCIECLVQQSAKATVSDHTIQFFVNLFLYIQICKPIVNPVL